MRKHFPAFVLCLAAMTVGCASTNQGEYQRVSAAAVPTPAVSDTSRPTYTAADIEFMDGMIAH
ncbi:MAG TPA: hypothetical protein VJ852_00100, partial [Gemmatimonadaceae bacterium]|nr:hypothetical protein [Gemmatimonadaceae bacterium]